jgi:hypothetical protein
MYNEQLKKKDNYLEEMKHRIEYLNSTRETNLQYIGELKDNVIMQEEINSLKEKESMHHEQLTEKDNYLETLKQQVKSLESVRETNFKYIEELKQQVEDLKYVKQSNLNDNEQLQKDELFKVDNESSQECEVLAAHVDHRKKGLSAESGVMIKSISDMSYEIESCRRVILKEIRCLKPNYDVELVNQDRLTKLLNVLFTIVMEKQKELVHQLQEQVNEMHSKSSECAKECADRDRRKDCWVRELEAEVEHLQQHVTKVEEEKKTLLMDDKLHCIKILEQEKADLIKKVRQSDTDLAIAQTELNHMKICNKEVAKKLEDLQLLVEEKDFLVSQLKKELESRFNEQLELETLKKQIFDLKRNNAVLAETLEMRNIENNLLLEKVEELQNALLLEKNKTQNVLTKLGLIEMELKTLSMINCDLKEEVSANKDAHSLLLREKERCSEITLSLKKVTEDLENLMAEKLAWDSEKQDFQAILATKENELSSERNLRCQLEKDMSTFDKLKEEKDQLKISYSQMLENYERLRSEADHSRVSKQVHNVSVSKFMYLKSEPCVTESDESLTLKKQLEEGMQKQKEMSVKNENMFMHVVGLREEVDKLSKENANLRESVETLIAEKDAINALLCIKNSEIEKLKRELVVRLHERAALDADCRHMQGHVQQQQDALCSENRSLIHRKDSCTESLHSESQLLSARLHDRVTGENCEAEVQKLEEQLEICVKEKLALDDENEQLVNRIYGLENMMRTICTLNDSLEKSTGTLEEDKKRLKSELSVSHKRLLDAENKIQQLQLKTLAMRKNDDALQEVSILRSHVKELRTEIENLRSKNKLLHGSQGASHDVAIRHARWRQLEKHLPGSTNVPKSSVATITDISGAVCYLFFT